MLVSGIFGGLGNQMFQYAIGRAQSLRLKTSFRLDISTFQSHEMHQGFELKRVFAIDAEIATEKDMREILGWQYSVLCRRLLARKSFASLKKTSYVVEPHFEYFRDVESVPEMCYLSGYWQSEKYFLSAATQIRNDFAFTIPLDGKNSEIAVQINQVNAVSLHVRRGDYVSNPNNVKIYHPCSVQYYARAIQLLAGRVESPQFFVFSDDIEWAENNLHIGPASVFVSHNRGTDSHKDMHLMSLCKHHIIANSSFSWWGAWLNPRPGKIVIGPSRWFTQPVNTRDLLPDEWLRV